jgi:HKD family nuclease
MSDKPMGQLVSYKKIEMEKNGQERLSQCDDNTSHDGSGDLIKTV